MFQVFVKFFQSIESMGGLYFCFISLNALPLSTNETLAYQLFHRFRGHVIRRFRVFTNQSFVVRRGQRYRHVTDNPAREDECRSTRFRAVEKRGEIRVLVTPTLDADSDAAHLTDSWFWCRRYFKDSSDIVEENTNDIRYEMH